MQQQIKTVQQFVEACKQVSSNDNNAIYEMFYASVELRELVFAEAERLGVVFADCNEPTRASMIALGEHYDVQQLRDY